MQMKKRKEREKQNKMYNIIFVRFSKRDFIKKLTNVLNIYNIVCQFFAY